MNKSAVAIYFYREVLRTARSLPTESQSYYKVLAREKFVAHRDEEDEERQALIIARSRKDLVWLKNKYKIVDPIPSTPTATPSHRHFKEPSTADDTDKPVPEWKVVDK